MTGESQTQITKMHNEGVVTHGQRTLTNNQKLVSLRNMNYPETEINKITGKGGFVERRCLVGTFQVKTTDPAAKFLYHVDPNTEIFKQKNIRDKLNNLSAMEATLRVILQVNSSPFNQGGIYAWTYLPDEAKPFNPTNYENITYVTSKDGIHMLFGGETEVSYDIPYISPQSNYSLTEGIPNGIWPHLYISVFSPLQSVSDTKVDVSVYIELINVKTHMPTLMPAKSVSLLDKFYDVYSGTLSQHKESMLRKVMNTLQRTTVVYSPDKAFAESGVDMPTEMTEGGSHTNLHEKEEKAQLDNPISLGVAKVTDLAKELITDLPISSIFEAPSWLGEPIQRLLGFGKPLNTTASNRVSIANQNNMVNSDVATSMVNFGLFATNRLAYKPVFESDQDEMNLNYITSKPAIIDTFRIQKSTAAGSIVYQHPVTPISFLRSTPNDIVYMTPLSWAASAFESWAGDIDYTFYIMKTPITNCRIQIGFSPGSSLLLPTDDTFMCYNEIYDLKDLQVIRFKVVWAHNNVMKNCPVLVGGELSPPVNGQSSTGLLFVKVINEFTGNDSVPPEIVIKVAHSSSNICFGNPRAPVFAPMANPTPPPPETAFAESGVDIDVGAKEQTEVKLVPPVLGRDAMFTFDRFTYSMGEVVLSFKQLLMRFTLSDVFTNSNNVANLRYLAYFPYHIRNVIGHTSGTRTFDYLDYIGAAYALKRGNVRLLVLPDWQDFRNGYWQGQHITTKDRLSLILSGINFDGERGVVTQVDPMGAYYYNIPTQLQQSSTNGTYEAQFPNYCNSTCTFAHRLDMGDLQLISDWLGADWIEPSLFTLHFPQVMPNGGRVYIYRAVDPNFQFGFWNGTPPLFQYYPQSKAIPTPP